jgi:hypothetical protein
MRHMTGLVNRPPARRSHSDNNRRISLGISSFKGGEQIAPCTRLQAGIRKSKLYTDGIIRYGNSAITEEPSTLQAALSDPNWKAAMESGFSGKRANFDRLQMGL